MHQTQADKFAQSVPPRELGVKRGWRYYGRRMLIDIAVAYVLLCFGIYLIQKRLVYQPTVQTSLSPRDFGFAPEQAEGIETMTSDSITLGGWYVHGKRGHPLANVSNESGAALGSTGSALAKAGLIDLFFCGNGGNRSDRMDTFRRLSSLGAHVVCFDYRGFGDSLGSPDEEGLARDARAAWDFLVGKGCSPETIIIHGESLGSAVAVRLTAELCAGKTPPAGLILEAAFTRLGAVAGKRYPFLPVSILLTQRFPSINRMPSITCPLLMLHGLQDDVVPVALGRELFAAGPGQSDSGILSEFVELPACGHNDIGQSDTELYDTAVAGFYKKVCPALDLPGTQSQERRKRPPPRERHLPGAPGDERKSSPHAPREGKTPE